MSANGKTGNHYKEAIAKFFPSSVTLTYMYLVRIEAIQFLFGKFLTYPDDKCTDVFLICTGNTALGHRTNLANQEYFMLQIEKAVILLMINILEDSLSSRVLNTEFRD